MGYLKQDPKLVYNFAHTESISCMQYSPDGNLLATSAGNNCNIRLWDAQLLSGS
ncbi:MAG: hypothetical protein IPJ00_15990 [Saprospirales bacterium]|nr:hypothetical protein [Saprospirales bacterium]